MRTNKLPLIVLGTLFLFLQSCSLFQKINDNRGNTNGDRPTLNEEGELLGGSGEDLFEVQFVQNEEEVPIEAGVVRLHRALFSIYLIMGEGDGVYINASMLYDERFTGDNDFDDLTSVYPKVMAEPSFNKDRELYLSEDNYSHWFYDSGLDWHRLSDIRVVDDKVIAEKEIENLVFADEGRSIAIDNIQDDLYIFFFSMEDTPSEGFKVRQRNYIKVEWQ